MEDIKTHSEIKSKKSMSKFVKICIFGLIGFCILQGYFLQNNVEKTEKIIQDIEDTNIKNFKLYNELADASRKYNQEQIINTFNNLNNNRNYTGSLLLSKHILFTQYKPSDKGLKREEQLKKEQPEEYELYRFKLTDETKEYIFREFNKRPKFGIDESRNLFKYSCFIIDIPCFLIRNSFDEANNKNINVVEDHIDTNIYNANHIKEFQNWIDTVLYNLDGTNKITPTPGQLEVNKKYK